MARSWKQWKHVKIQARHVITYYSLQKWKAESEKQRTNTACLQKFKAQLSAARQVAALHQLEVQPTSWKITAASIQVGGCLCHSELHSSLRLSLTGCDFTTSSTWQCTLILHAFSYCQMPNHRAGNKDPRLSWDATHNVLQLQRSASSFWLNGTLKVPLKILKNNSKAPAILMVTILAWSVLLPLL